MCPVRCLGGAGVAGNPNQVFDSVVFKGSDIVELTVLAPPAQTAPPPQPAYAPPPPPGATAWGAPPPQQPQEQQQIQEQQRAPETQIPDSVPNAWNKPLSGDSSTIPAEANAKPAPTVSIASMPKLQENGVGVATGSRPRPSSYANAAGGPPPGASGARGRGGPRGGGRGGGPSGAPRGRGRHVVAVRGRGGRGAGRVGPPQPVPEVSIPKEEFNFEEALKKFNKDQLSKEVAETTEVELSQVAVKTVYKKDDFFDELSCEALERLADKEAGASSGHRGRMAAQRRTDVETFGGAAAHRGHRGRGRGGRGRRGGARGGRGYNRSSGNPSQQAKEVEA